MDDETHVGLVNAHTEGYRSHDDVNLLHEEVVLRLRTCTGVQSSMIGCRLDFVGLQYLCQFLYFLARQAIDDATL